MLTIPAKKDLKPLPEFISGGVWRNIQKYLSPDGDVTVYWVEFVHRHVKHQDHCLLRFIRGGHLHCNKGEWYNFKKDLDGAIKYAKRLERAPANVRRSVAANELYEAPAPEAVN